MNGYDCGVFAVKVDQNIPVTENGPPVVHACHMKMLLYVGSTMHCISKATIVQSGTVLWPYTYFITIILEVLFHFRKIH